MTNEEYIDFMEQTFKDMSEIIRQKNSDYTTNRGPFHNFKGAAAFGVDPVVGLMVRMSDKFKRLETWATTEQLNNESVEDTLKDIIGYATLGLGMFEDMRRGDAIVAGVLNFTEEDLEELTKNLGGPA